MPDLSVVVVVYDIPRQAERTLLTLSADYQRWIDADDYEVIVVDNGSTPPLDPASLDRLRGNFRLIRIDDALPSPARAFNRGLAAARGNVIGMMIDGARLVTPGMLHYARLGATGCPAAVVASLGWYLGGDVQGEAAQAGYDAAAEDALLASIGWPDDGYRLFEIATIDESSVDGWFHPIAESNSLFMSRTMWNRLGGLDERFDAAGGGLLNLDTCRRALEVEGAESIVLLGEGSFHQVHGGVSTNQSSERQAANWHAWHAQYQELTGRDFSYVPRLRPATLIGMLPPAALSAFTRAALAPARPGYQPLVPGFDQCAWPEVAAPPGDAITAGLVDLAQRELRSGRPAAAGAVARFARSRDPQDRSTLRLLASTAHHLRLAPDDAHRALALGHAHRIAGDAGRAAEYFRTALERHPGWVEAHLALSDLRMPAAHYLTWLEWIYGRLAPASALEIGVFHGHSLALHRPPTVAIGVDPEPLVSQPLRAETHIFPQTSDDFFASGRLEALLGSRPIAVGFIDGLHLFEQALRDFINIEARSRPDSVILLHDTVPLDEVTQRRDRETQFHTGDVWRTVLCLKRHRPDLRISTIAAPPTGLTIVTGLDPHSTRLDAHFDDYVAEFLAMPFAEVEADLRDHVNLMPADAASIEPLLAPPRSTV